MPSMAIPLDIGTCFLRPSPGMAACRRGGTPRSSSLGYLRSQRTRVFGYFPIATHLAMKPTAVTSRSFVDGAGHRTGTPKVYNLYEIQPQGPDPRMDSLISLFRALFITSYTAADYLRERHYFKAEQFVISSASSKTAYGIAHCLSDVPTPKIGLTSRRNKSFVEGLGCYDAVYVYEELTDIDPTKSTVYVDLSGDDTLHRRVHEHFRDRLAFDCLVGSTQSTSFPEQDEDLPRTRPGVLLRCAPT